MANMTKCRYSPLPLNDDTDNVDDDAASPKTTLKSFIRINSLSFKRGKHVREKQIRNPYGNVYRKRRMSISCPSSPIGGKFKPIAQILAEVSEKLLEESEDINHPDNNAGKILSGINQYANMYVY